VWPILLKNSGWGSLSIDEAKDRLPESWGQATDRLIQFWVDDLPLHNKTAIDLESASGIGRLCNALSFHGFELQRWPAGDYSRPSVALLQRFLSNIHRAYCSFTTIDPNCVSAMTEPP